MEEIRLQECTFITKLCTSRSENFSNCTLERCLQGVRSTKFCNFTSNRLQGVVKTPPNEPLRDILRKQISDKFKINLSKIDQRIKEHSCKFINSPL